jgi:hypothetical protein
MVDVGPTHGTDPRCIARGRERAVRVRHRTLRKSKGPEGESIDAATLRKYDVLLNDRLVPWCRAHGMTSVKQLENKTICEDFVHSWRNLNPNKNRRNLRWTEKLLSRTTKVAELGRLRYFLDYCVSCEWLDSNGAKKRSRWKRAGAVTQNTG